MQRNDNEITINPTKMTPEQNKWLWLLFQQATKSTPKRKVFNKSVKYTVDINSDNSATPGYRTIILTHVIVRRSYINSRGKNEYKYTVLCTQLLGSGGFAEVYKVAITLKPTLSGYLESSHTKSRAIKIVDMSKYSNRDAITLLKREASFGARLNHLSSKRVTFDKSSKQAFFVMRLVNGEEFFDYFTHPGNKITTNQRIQFSYQLTDVLSEQAHDYDIVHCDYSFSNVMFDEAKRVFNIIDLGLALPEGFHDGSIVGQLAYMAPEAFDPRVPVSKMRDYYSLGLVLCSVWLGQQRPVSNALLVQIKTSQGIELAKLASENQLNTQTLLSLQQAKVVIELMQRLLVIEPKNRAPLDQISLGFRELEIEYNMFAAEYMTAVRQGYQARVALRAVAKQKINPLERNALADVLAAQLDQLPSTLSQGAVEYFITTLGINALEKNTTKEQIQDTVTKIFNTYDVHYAAVSAYANFLKQLNNVLSKFSQQQEAYHKTLLPFSERLDELDSLLCKMNKAKHRNTLDTYYYLAEKLVNGLAQVKFKYEADIINTRLPLWSAYSVLLTRLNELQVVMPQGFFNIILEHIDALLTPEYLATHADKTNTEDLVALNGIITTVETNPKNDLAPTVTVLLQQGIFSQNAASKLKTLFKLDEQVNGLKP